MDQNGSKWPGTIGRGARGRVKANQLEKQEVGPHLIEVNRGLKPRRAKASGLRSFDDSTEVVYPIARACGLSSNSAVSLLSASGRQ
jgi:hypothetical protein